MIKEKQDPEAGSDVKAPAAKNRRLSQAGVVLILLSGACWFSMIAVPFTSLTIGQKTFVAGGLFVAVQVTWWTGAALAGPEIVGKM